MKKEVKKRNALCRKFSRLNQGYDLAKATHAFLPELSGSGGRKATTGEKSETSEAEELFDIFKTKGFDITVRRPNWKTVFSFPEQNDELLWGIKRVRSQLFRLNRWSEQLGNKPNSKPHQAAVEIVAHFTETIRCLNSQQLQAARETQKTNRRLGRRISGLLQSHTSKTRRPHLALASRTLGMAA